MDLTRYRPAEEYMLRNMEATVHDTLHIYRVLYLSLHILQTEPKADRDVVALSALLHDIGRAESAAHPGKSHAEAGAEMALEFLRAEGWPESTAIHVRDCILTHSSSGKNPPASLEGKILFDADKLDLSGAIGVARAIQFGTHIEEPLYRTDAMGRMLPGKKGEGPSLLREYRRKLRSLADAFYTKEGRRLGAKNQKSMDRYFSDLKKQIKMVYKMAKK